MTGEKKCYITQIEYLIKNGLVGMDTLDSEAKVYIFYKKEDMIPVDLHVEIHKKVSAQLEYLKADTDSEKYLMLGMLIGKNADSAEYVIVSNEFDLGRLPVPLNSVRIFKVLRQGQKRKENQ